MRQMAIMGFGTIGSGVFDVVNTNRDVIRRHLGEELRVKYVLDIREFPGEPVEEVLIHDVNILLEDPEVDVVVETMGGLEPAFTFVRRALEAGKSVATSNKELVAKRGVELLALAREKQVNFFFGASVGGGIPIIRPKLRSLCADEIEEVTGILNGTTNYILTKMAQEGSSFADALREAQENGFAERKPEADVEGFDACRKIAILSSIALERHVDFEEIYTEGITAITQEDFLYAAKLGWSIKLLASSRKEGNRVYAMVAPALVKPGHPLFAVSDVFNGILVHGNMVDDVMFYGRGAGSHATASAVTADVMEALRHPHENIYAGWSGEKQALSDIGSWEKQFLVRAAGDASREPELAQAFGHGILVDAGVAGEIGYLTPVISEKAFAEAAASLEGVKSRIRVQA